MWWISGRNLFVLAMHIVFAHDILGASAIESLPDHLVQGYTRVGWKMACHVGSEKYVRSISTQSLCN